MAQKKASGSVVSAARKVLYARLPQPVFKKLERIAANRSLKRGSRVTLQDTVIDLINEARA
jgi:hypothetical protein